MDQTKKEKNELWEWGKALFVALAVAGLIRFFLFAPVVVDGESMMPTLENEDRMLVNKIGYFIGEPERSDIVVFHATKDKDYIKRVIGVPGDYVAYENDQLYINVKAQGEPYLSSLKEQYNLGSGTLTEDFTLEGLTELDKIPEGYVFVLGDNRRSSTDSRIIGLVPITNITGSTNYVFWPLNEMGFVE
ncbi:S26 family signal peptidase [Planococcus kocurii]|uniref:Signal peptidase I n=1 Tax=Planococcus kocurii TaxID=1374 RepID=A0ABM5WWQ4_9BACL|nr:signal peptidase I [Planococcus kocurii]ALS78780.1 S26 family signal peptidase [Planococcus kocurii]